MPVAVRYAYRQEFMDLALRLARRGRRSCSPNPMVGAVVVRGERIVGKGYHRRAGENHAEVNALDQAGDKARGAALYVTLEPCAHYGRTPPCTGRIIKSGISRVFVAMLDPNPVNNGRGVAQLRQHGIGVSVGHREQEALTLNEVFIKYITRRLPFVTVKVGQSLDGRIATVSGSSQWITGEESRRYAHRLRGDFDAIMVGVNTVLRDNPKLDAWFSRRQPVKVIVDSRLSTPTDATLFAGGARVVIATLPEQPGQETQNRAALARTTQILEVKELSGQVNLRDLLKKLARLEISSVLVEGGGNLIGSLFDEGLVDRVLFFINPRIIGGKDAIGSVMGKGVSRVDAAWCLRQVRLKRIGEDFLVEGRVADRCSPGSSKS